MATIEGALRTLLAADAGVTALLGAGANCRVYPLDRPADALRPFVLYRKESSERTQALGGLTNYREAVLVYDCIGAEEAGYASANDVAEAITDALLGFGSGSLASGAIRVEGIFLEDLSDDVNVPEIQEEFGVMRATVAIRVGWNQG